MMTSSTSTAFLLSGVRKPISSPIKSSSLLSVTTFGWRDQSNKVISSIPHGSNKKMFRLRAGAIVSAGKRSSKADVIMVDPSEAKRLAAKQMEEIQAKEKLKIQRRIEAINGAWAMIGLTAGLLVEGQTGNGILAQGDKMEDFISINLQHSL